MTGWERQHRVEETDRIWRRQVWWGLETHRHFLPQQHTVNAGVLMRAIILKKKKKSK